MNSRLYGGIYILHCFVVKKKKIFYDKLAFTTVKWGCGRNYTLLLAMQVQARMQIYYTDGEKGYM